MNGAYGSRGRGQSGPLGLLLVFALVVGSTAVVVVVGSAAIDGSQQQLGADTAENAMTQLDSQTSLVALGSSELQAVELGSGRSAAYTVDADAGWMNISYESANGTTTILNTTMGAVTYEAGDRTRIAYQGGGVWRESGSGSVMVSPPEFHYRESTLTLPLVTIGTSGTIEGEAIITPERTTRHYPNETRANPLQGGSVDVEIHSAYHEGWHAYLQGRTEGTVEHYPSEERVVMTLTVPVTETFDRAVAATSDDSDAIDNTSTSPNGGFDSPIDTGVAAPAADYRIENEIANCEAGNCDDLPTELSDDTLESGAYYSNSGITIDETDYQTGSGDITVVVDGDLTFDGGGGPPGTTHHEILGSGNVTFYVNGSVSLSGNTGVNTGGDPSQLLVLVHSRGGTVATASGTPQFTGLIYAPNSSLRINGGGNPSHDNIVGAVVVEDAEANGNGNLRYDSSIEYRLSFNSASEIRYLHVSENSVNITGS